MEFVKVCMPGCGSSGSVEKARVTEWKPKCQHGIPLCDLLGGASKAPPNNTGHCHCSWLLIIARWEEPSAGDITRVGSRSFRNQPQLSRTLRPWRLSYIGSAGKCCEGCGEREDTNGLTHQETLLATILTCLAGCATGVVEVTQLGEQPHAFLFVKPDPHLILWAQSKAHDWWCHRC